MLKTPPLQTATATIDTLCGRLQSATLLEDRRAAILGLRSFAKQYPASVASGSLRELITTLRRDGLGEIANAKGRDAEGRGEEGGDVDTIRLVLETLLMLFNPDSSSPETSDEIAFFMADEFSMRQDNVSLLLNLLDPTSPFADYYSRLYSVQLLSAICAARPERLQECILNAPLGTSRVVGVLDDGRDAVRNAGLLLLVDLTGGANEDLRKIVAFEDVFGKVFALIRLEGGLADAGIAGQDCLSLLANLVRGSASNQTMFRESGCVGQLTQLLREILPPSAIEAQFIAESREKAGWGVIQLLRLFLVRGETSSTQNQIAFFRAGTAQLLLDIGFHPNLPVPIRVIALRTASDLISNNPPLQEAFAPLQIEVNPANDALPAAAPQANGSRSSNPSARNSARASVEKQRTYVIEALLELTLSQPRGESSLRAAACTLIQAYLAKHDRIKAHFLQRAIMGHKEGEDAANVLTALLQPGTDTIGVVFASWIVQDLVADMADTKLSLAAVKEGDESEGEDVLTAIQAMGTQLEGALQAGADGRIVASYASTLTVLLWEFADGVNDLLAEASGLIQALVASVASGATAPTTAGLAAVLLGTIYEFSTKDSPIPRRTLAPLLTQKLGRGKYLDALLNLRRDPAIRDFGLEEFDGDAETVNETFVDLFLTEYPRLRKAIDKDPGIEVLHFSAAEAGVDRDVLDDLRHQLQSVKDALAAAQQEALAAAQQAEQDKLTLQKSTQTAETEAERLRRINQALQHGHEEESQKIKQQHQRENEGLNVEHARALANARQEADRQARQAKEQTEQTFAARVREFEQKLAELGNAHRSEQSGHSSARQQLEALAQRHSELTAREQDVTSRLQDSTKAFQDLERSHQQLQARASQAESDLEDARKRLEEQEAELTTHKTQLDELREELKGRDAELATERAGYSELEKEFEAAKSASAAKAEGDSEAAAKVQKLETLSKSLAGKVKELQASLEETRSSEKSAKEAGEKGEKGMEEAKKAEDEAKKAAELAKEAEKSAKEELESLLLVLGEIEGKRDEYKAKVKELGGEVTEDEDSDEDGEEESDDDTLD